MNFPLIYCNGDSYSNENYHPSLVGQAYANVVAKNLNGFVINKSINGSCNRRIIRTTLYDVLEQRRINPVQPIVALVGLTFDARSEIWVENKLNSLSEESNFESHTFSKSLSWRENLLNGIKINNYTGFLKKYSEGRAFFYSPYAERINLLADVIMLTTVFEKYNIKYVIFYAVKAEKLETEHLVDSFKLEIQHNKNIIDFEEFGFTNWSCEQGFIPLDKLKTPEVGHYGADAHKHFAQEILLPRIEL